MDKIRLATKDDDLSHYFVRFLTIPGGCLGFLPSTVVTSDRKYVIILYGSTINHFYDILIETSPLHLS